MKFAKIMPAFRMRDGFENLEKNNRVFMSALKLCALDMQYIMPEGGQGEEHKIRPLVKGIFRLAFERNRNLEKTKKVKIVPIGINMGDLIKCGKHLIINVGKPIEVEEYMEQYQENAPAALNDIRLELHQKLSELTLDLATDENYDTFETITDIMGEEFVENEEKLNPTFEKFKLKQTAARTLAAIEKNDRSLMAELNRLAQSYNSMLKKLSFKSSVFSQLKSDETSFLRFFSLLITLPVALFGFITNTLPALVPVWVRRAAAVNYSGFYSSFHFGLGMISFPILYILQALVFHWTLSPNWGMTLIFLVFQFFTRQFTLKWYSNLIRYFHKIRFNSLLTAKLEQSAALYKLIDVRNRIVYRMKTRQRENLAASS